MFAPQSARSARAFSAAPAKSVRGSRLQCRADTGDTPQKVKEAEEAKGISEPDRAAFTENGASKAEAVTDLGPPSGLPDSVTKTLTPRVAQLKRKQLSEGTTDFTKIMAFNGPVPELVNGRLAMMGFFAAVSAEVRTHVPISQQFMDTPGLILGISLILTIASIIPVVRGSAIFDDGGGEGFRPGFNITNELINGRAAMLGIAIFLIYELGAGGPLF